MKAKSLQDLKAMRQQLAEAQKRATQAAAERARAEGSRTLLFLLDCEQAWMCRYKNKMIK